MTLVSGKYSPKAEKTVTHWPKPDKNGDGDLLWQDQKDDAGNVLGRDQVYDAAGNEVREYNPPKGFINRPSFDHSDNYVRVDDKGRILRNPAGEAVGISQGWTLIEYADGTSEHLKDDYSRMLFEKAHNLVSEDSPA